MDPLRFENDWVLTGNGAVLDSQNSGFAITLGTPGAPVQFATLEPFLGGQNRKVGQSRVYADGMLISHQEYDIVDEGVTEHYTKLGAGGEVDPDSTSVNLQSKRVIQDGASRKIELDFTHSGVV